MWVHLEWHEHRLQASALWLVIMFFHLVPMQSCSIRKPPLAERALVRRLPGAVFEKNMLTGQHLLTSVYRE